MIDKRVQLGKAHSLISTLVLGNYYGELSLKFESGNIIHMRTTQNFKIEDLHRPGGVKLVSVTNAGTSETDGGVPRE